MTPRRRRPNVRKIERLGGKLTATARYKRGRKTIKIATVRKTVAAAGTVKLSSAARKVLASKRKLTVTFTFAPNGGTSASKSSTVTTRVADEKT